MTRAVRCALIGVALATLLAPSPAIARRKVPVMVQTVPATPGIEFALAGRRFTSDENGLALFTVSSRRTFTLEVIDTRFFRGNSRSEFSIWSDGATRPRRKVRVRTFTWLQAGFEVSLRVQPQLEYTEGDGAPAEIDSLVLREDDGGQLELSGAGPHWLPARTLRATDDGVRPKPIGYVVDAVVAEGQELTPASQSSWVPRRDETWTIMVESPPPSTEPVQPAVRPTHLPWLLGLGIGAPLLLVGALWLIRARARGRHALDAPAQPERVVDLRSPELAPKPPSSQSVPSELEDAIREAQRFIDRLEEERRLLTDDHGARHGHQQRPAAGQS